MHNYNLDPLPKKSSNTCFEEVRVSRNMKEWLNAHKSVVILFTGLSGSGKTTLAMLVEERLYERKCRTVLLDGDNVRHGLCGDLGFSLVDRNENIRRVAEVSNVLKNSGLIVLSAFISPMEEQRNVIKNTVSEKDYIEVFCDSSIDVCKKRDKKGLYKKAGDGLIDDYTGVSSPYERPVSPDLHLHTDVKSIDECVEKIMSVLDGMGVFLNKGGGCYV